MVKWSNDLRIKERLLSVKLVHAPDDYYSWSFEQRAACLQAHSTKALCKTIIMKNVLFNKDHPADPTYPKFVCVITQYVAKLNGHKVKNLMKAYQNSTTEVQKAYSSGFKFRLADEADAVELTGYGHNGMTPFYMKNDSLLIILS